MPALPPPPPGLDIHASRQPSLYAATIITWILAVVAVGLRFWCRKMTKSGYKLDDWLVVVATVNIYQSNCFVPMLTVGLAFRARFSREHTLLLEAFPNLVPSSN